MQTGLGKIRRIHLLPGDSKPARNLLLDLLFDLRLLLPDQTVQHWKRIEQDRRGQYEASYRKISEEMRRDGIVIRIEKKRGKPLARSTFSGAEQTSPANLRGKMQATFDPLTGQLLAMNIDETSLGSKRSVSLRLTGAAPEPNDLQFRPDRLVRFLHTCPVIEIAARPFAEPEER